MELELDFAEEDVEFASRSELKLLVERIQTEVVSLRDSFALGNVIKRGWHWYWLADRMRGRARCLIRY